MNDHYKRFYTAWIYQQHRLVSFIQRKFKAVIFITRLTASLLNDRDRGSDGNNRVPLLFLFDGLHEHFSDVNRMFGLCGARDDVLVLYIIPWIYNQITNDIKYWDGDLFEHVD